MSGVSENMAQEKKKNELKENIQLKRGLILQSFAPLFLLMTMKHLDIGLYYSLICKFFDMCGEKGAAAWIKAVFHPAFGGFVVSVLGILWILMTVFITWGFKGMQEAGFHAEAEWIVQEETAGDSGVTFLLTYVLPFLTDDVASLRGLVVYLTMLAMIIILLERADTFYQNPVLAALGYHTFSFRFENPAEDIPDPDKAYIGIIHGKREDGSIKRKYIADGVFLIAMSTEEGKNHNGGSKEVNGTTGQRKAF